MPEEADKYIKKIEADFKAFEGRFDHHLDIYRQNGKELAALKNEVKNVDKNIESMKVMMTNLFNEHSTRLRTLENWRWYIMGGIGVILIGGGFGVSLISNNLEYKTQLAIEKALSAYDVSVE